MTDETTTDETTTGSTRTDEVVERYSGLARLARDGGIPLEREPRGCSGAAAYAAGDDAPEDALRASLGCGNPLAVAGLRPGETVLDLGSGGGLDVLLSARRVGPSGLAYGLEAGEEMLALARAAAERAGAAGARFLRGRIEDVPLPDGSVDVVISNCVVNLSADKPRVLAEAFRVLRPGGRLGISDVIAGDGPARRAGAGCGDGCGDGALTTGQYRRELAAAGFVAIAVTPAADAGGVRAAIVQAVKPG